MANQVIANQTLDCSKTLDLSRWAIVAHKDDTGFGRMAADYKRLLGIERHLVIPSERLTDKPLTAPQEVWLRPEDTLLRLQEVLSGLQGILFFERSGWHPQLLPTAKEMGIRTVCVPMWEWFNAKDPLWKNCDLFICPNRQCCDVLRRFGFRNAVLLPTLLDVTVFPRREVCGPARVFVHNAGLVDHDDRKGTRDVIRAFARMRRQDVRLIVRMQKEAELPEEARDPRITVHVGSLSDPSALYSEGDVAVQPSKMEGIGFMVLEPVCCGLPVITLDYGPMNEFVRQPEMRVRKQPFARRAFPSQWIKQAHLRLPSSSDLTRRMEWCAENDLSAISRENRRWAGETFAPQPLKAAWEEVLQARLLNSV